MNILFYYPDKERAVSLSSLMIAFAKQGHKVHLLTHTGEGDLHRDVKAAGVLTFNHTIPKNSFLTFYLSHIFYLARFTREHRIDVAYSHIQLANIISAFAQFMTHTRFILCRHHSDCAYVDNNWKEKVFDRIINSLGKEFIAPSKKVFDQMTLTEKVRKKKIHLINYAYDFDLYPKPDPDKVRNIREQYNAKLLLIKVARLIPEKRHIILFQAVNKLIKLGLDIKLLVLSEGTEKNLLSTYIVDNQLENNIFMLGYKKNVIDYLKASDLVVHVSASEASNNLIKEASLVERTAIVCKEVGDFDDYMEDQKNGYVISLENTEQELLALLNRIYQDLTSLDKAGKLLKARIYELFSIGNVLPKYAQFHTNKPD